MGPGRPATAAGAAVLVAFGVLAFTPFAAWLHRRLVDTVTAPLQADAVVVLGAGLMPEGELTDHSLRRLVEGMRLQRRGGAPLLVVLGPPYGPGSEAEARARVARELGMPDDVLVVEPRGRTTREEALRVAEVLSRRGLRRVALVTGAHHMARARMAFVAAGLDVVAVPVTERSGRPRRPEDRLALGWVLVQEAVARLLYRAAGAF